MKPSSNSRSAVVCSILILVFVPRLPSASINTLLFLLSRCILLLLLLLRPKKRIVLTPTSFFTSARCSWNRFEEGSRGYCFELRFRELGQAWNNNTCGDFSSFLIYNLCPFDTRDDSLMIRMMIEMIRDQVKLYDFG